MQIMPLTALHHGIDLYSPAETQIKDGCKIIYRLKEKYREYYLKEDDLLKIVLTAYNTGNGNVDAVRNLAEEKGLNPNTWKDMEYVLQNAADKSFTQGAAIKGRAALNYVYKVWTHYAHYKNMQAE
jgi:membrane-bound lytic murein transglycosylase F